MDEDNADQVADVVEKGGHTGRKLLLIALLVVGVGAVIMVVKKRKQGDDEA
ncbi:MAG: hypothetical protein KDC39_12990 [Actinobacteria bacterium]|nr:hypothetical protein [Actinomycetota bacterium]